MGIFVDIANNEQPLERSKKMSPERVIPKLRRVIEITDYDTGQPIVHRIELRECDRIDCYDAFVDGVLWKRRVGWSNVLTGIRKAMPRLARA